MAASAMTVQASVFGHAAWRCMGVSSHLIPQICGPTRCEGALGPAQRCRTQGTQQIVPHERAIWATVTSRRQCPKQPPLYTTTFPSINMHFAFTPLSSSLTESARSWTQVPCHTLLGAGIHPPTGRIGIGRRSRYWVGRRCRHVFRRVGRRRVPLSHVLLGRRRLVGPRRSAVRIPHWIALLTNLPSLGSACAPWPPQRQPPRAATAPPAPATQCPPRPGSPARSSTDGG